MNARADRFKTASPTNSSTDRTSKPTRCAIYTRKSTSEGLSADFNTLDAKREAAEHYILAMKREGWEALPAHYDDGGFTGANTERPALKRLIADNPFNPRPCDPDCPVLNWGNLIRAFSYQVHLLGDSLPPKILEFWLAM